MTLLEATDGVGDSGPENDSRDMTFMCGKPVVQPAPQPQAPQQLVPQPQAKQTAPQVRLLLQGNANFATDSAALSAVAKENLDHFMIANQSVNLHRVTVMGYTDKIGSEAHNLKLSQARAAAVVPNVCVTAASRPTSSSRVVWVALNLGFRRMRPPKAACRTAALTSAYWPNKQQRALFDHEGLPLAQAFFMCASSTFAVDSQPADHPFRLSHPLRQLRPARQRHADSKNVADRQMRYARGHRREDVGVLVDVREEAHARHARERRIAVRDRDDPRAAVERRFARVENVLVRPVFEIATTTSPAPSSAADVVYVCGSE